jgi:uncharacterized membrane protein
LIYINALFVTAPILASIQRQESAILRSSYWPMAGYIPKSGTDERSLAPYFMLALAFIGIADAFYDSYAIHTGQLLWCPPPIDGCNIVASSPYARIVGVPLGYFGLVYYLYMFGLVALLAFDPFSRGLRVGALLYAAVGVLFSMYFMYVQVTFIHAFCIYCLISAILTLLLLIAAFEHFRATRWIEGATMMNPTVNQVQASRCRIG